MQAIVVEYQHVNDCVAGVLRQIAPLLKPEQVLVSVIAGVPLSVLCKPLPDFVKVVRSMPNTPMLVGQG